MAQQLQKEEGRNQAFNAREFLYKYLKYLPWILLSIFLFLFLAYLKLRYSTDIYAVKAKMMIKNENNYGNQDRMQDLFMTNSNQNLNDEVEIMKSTALAKRIVNALNLQTSYYNKGKVKSSLLYREDSPFRIEILEVKDSMQAFSCEVKFINESTLNLNKSTTPVYFGQIIEYPFAKFRLMKQSISYTRFGTNEFIVTWSPTNNLAADIAGSFSIAPINDFSSILNITYETQNPKIGREIVNQLMLEYNDATVEDKLRMTKYTLEFIDVRLDTLKRELGGVEQNLKSFQEKNRAIDLDQQSLITFNQLSEANQVLSEQEVQLKVLGYLQNYLSDKRNNTKTVPTQLGIEEPSLQIQIQEYNAAVLKKESELKTTTPANHLIQELDAQIENLRQQIAENLRNIQQSYLINRNNLINKSRSAQTEISAVPGKTKQLLEISREKKVLEDLYSFLLQKKLETSISSASTISNTKVIEPAQSSNLPIKPNGRSLYLISFILGMAVPAAIIFLIELLNDKIRNRADVERLISAPIVGEIGHSQDTQTLVVSKNNRKFIAEQFRIVRTNLQFVLTKTERPVILVTSSFSGEGKSFISTNIGAVMAVAGKKTVILEFDIRKPKIIAGLDLSRKTGITNYIVGTATIPEIILPVQQVENLFVIACGPLPPNPAELLLDDKVRELFSYLRENFEAVIVDSAPVGLVSDAIILSHHVDATLYILRENYTLKKQSGLINALYREKKLPKLSVLLNDVKTGSGGGYYGYGYGYGHGSGYFAEEAKPRSGFLGKIRNYFS